MAWNFDGSMGYLAAASAPATAAPLTMACWFRHTGSPANSRHLVSISNPATSHFFSLGTGSGTVGTIWAMAVDGGISAAFTSTSLVSGQWHHAAAVFASGSQRSAYLDAGGKGSNTDVRSPASVSQTRIGSGTFGSFAGDVGEVAVWSVALTDDEVATLARGLSPLLLWHRLPNLVMYQDLVRPLNRPGVGPALTSYGGTSVTPHPRMIYPTSCQPDLLPPQFAVPYRLAAAAAHAGRTAQGWAALAGAEQGTTYPLGEVLS